MCPIPLYLEPVVSQLSIESGDVAAHASACCGRFRFLGAAPGSLTLAMHPVSWSEPTILERRFPSWIDPGSRRSLIAAEFASRRLRLCVRSLLGSVDSSGAARRNGCWSRRWCDSSSHGEEFEEGADEQTGHIRLISASTRLFCRTKCDSTAKRNAKIRDNVQKLVEFTAKVEKNAGATARLLWSESEENLAQKLIARLQKVQ